MFKITILLLSLFFHSSSVLCQNSLHVMTLHSNDAPVQTLGVSVDEDKLTKVSNNILTAENWLRTHVLSYYPSTNIKYIILTNKLLCNAENINQEDMITMVMNAMKNLHHSLTRWGLEREIKVSVSFSVSVSSGCFRNSYLKPVFGLLEKINSTYTVNPTRFSDEIVELLASELKSINGLDGFRSETVNVIVPALNQARFTSRKLSFIDDLWSVSAPPPPAVEFSPAPEIQAPVMAPASSPSHPYGYGYSLPPCNPYPHGYHAAPPAVRAAPPMVGKVGEPMAATPMAKEELWCVAKPSVPSEKLQVALDYACGAGGADCGPIKPNGSCYSPDSVVAHASYAFNSYWQKNKKNGGVCGFEGTAMLISSDPSFLHCRFILG
ncbi:putative glucan endo-1,3-beta-D-glucosidase [Helianthus annuus]|nr:putative glucan endo-1,3-beta-D-glucosidase [Helianthus annuus]KAJ0873450.1 putative glucan endo-1,3-beta-D-glucosidase [Helianthus annuus]